MLNIYLYNSQLFLSRIQCTEIVTVPSFLPPETKEDQEQKTINSTIHKITFKDKLKVKLSENG